MRRSRRTVGGFALAAALLLAAAGAVAVTARPGGAVAVTARSGGADAAPVGRGTLHVVPRLRAMLPDDVRAAGEVVVADDPSYPPASSFAADGRTVVGFEPDLAAALGQVLGVRVRVEAAGFDTLLDGLPAHRYDAVMSAMTVTPERERRADFVAYFRAGTSIVVRSGDPLGIHGLQDLCGRSVAVQAGTVQVDLIARHQVGCGSRPVDVLQTSSNDDALLQLRTGRAAAVLTDYPPAVAVTTGARTRASYQLASDAQYEPGLYGVAVAKDRTRLRDALAAAMRQVVGSGTYARVLQRWGVEQGALSAADGVRGA